MNYMRSEDAQKQLARTPLSAQGQRCLACACPVAGYIDHVIHWRVSVFLCARFCQPFSSSPPLPLGFVSFFSTDAFQCDRCLFLSFRVGAHGWLALLCQSWGHYFNLGLAANSGSPLILQAPNLHLAMQLLTRKWWVIWKEISF